MKARYSAAWIAGIAVCLLLVTSQSALADGIIIVEPPDVEEPSYLAVKYHRVTVTIEDQVATTHVDQVFVNESAHQMEGTYVFPLPAGATISDFAMWVDGERLSGEMLPADEARRVYEDIVRRQRDPALLEYIGRNTFRARIFPIAPRSEKRVEIEYTEILSLDNGLVHYRYPLDTERFSVKPIEDVSIRVEIHSREAVKAVYSPSHDIDIDRRGNHNVTVGYEELDVLPDTDFELYYSVAQEDLGLNLLSFASDAKDGLETSEGFFLMLLAPKVEVDPAEIVAKDVLLVLDTSGSMRGDKLAQAKGALSFILDQLHERDRFNVVTFSTGVRQFAKGLQDATRRDSASHWVAELEAKGGTDINRAMLEAVDQVDPERPTILIFLTDGLATEGVIATDKILRNVEEVASDTVRIFSFGVGDDVNTVLLDRMSNDHRGASAYVRPGQRIDEKVSAFYAKVSTPLLSDIRVSFGDIHTEDPYPYPLPDLFAGTQIILAGRYRDGGETTVTVRGTINGTDRVFRFEQVHFREKGGEAFIPRLWATRKVGHLLNQIRLHGESEELVAEIVDLAVRYGIMTPYTSFLIHEDNEVFSEEGRERTVQRELSIMATASPAPPSGKAAVDEAESKAEMERSNTATGATGSQVAIVGDKTFLLREGMWIDTTFDASRMTPIKVGFLSEAYFALLNARPEWGPYFAVGERVLVVLEDMKGEGPQAYLVVEEGKGDPIDIATRQQVLVAPTTGATPTGQPSRPASTASQPEATEEGSTSKALCQGAAVTALVPLLAALWLARRR